MPHVSSKIMCIEENENHTKIWIKMIINDWIMSNVSIKIVCIDQAQLIDQSGRGV